MSEPMPGIPANVACPHCGGYVRGHQWIGMSEPECSITVVKPDRNFPVRVLLWDGAARLISDVTTQVGIQHVFDRPMFVGGLALLGGGDSVPPLWTPAAAREQAEQQVR